jgi:hypothetical protein
LFSEQRACNKLRIQTYLSHYGRREVEERKKERKKEEKKEKKKKKDTDRNMVGWFLGVGG